MAFGFFDRIKDGLEKTRKSFVKNVERFSSYLNRVNKETQFIVVSHRKKTMEAAEVLQGVTMVERGVSRLLTVAFEDVKEDLA